MKMTRRWLLVAFGALLAARPAAAAPDLTGTWTLGVEGDHVIPMAMVMKQDGNKISGTIAMPINQQGDRRDIPFEGELTADGFTFVSMEGAPRFEFKGKLNDDGALGGMVTVSGSGHEHAMKWTAERLKERKKG